MTSARIAPDPFSHTPSGNAHGAHHSTVNPAIRLEYQPHFAPEIPAVLQ
jgi:hypothetical protein